MIVSINLHAFYSIQHIRAVAHFARRSARYRRRWDRSRASPRQWAMEAHAVAAVMSAVAFLEAASNELLAEAIANNPGYLSGCSPEVLERLRIFAKDPTTKRLTVSEKLKSLSRSGHPPQVDWGRSPGQDIIALIAIRNRFVHYDPEWLDWGTDPRPGALSLSDLSKDLRRFPWVDVPPAHPQWIGDGLAAWAVTTAITIMDAICASLGMAETQYDHVRSDLVL